MKRNFLSMGCLIMAFVLLWTNYHGNSESSNVKSVLLKQNVEALTQGENPGVRVKCYTSLKYEFGHYVVDCTTCSMVFNASDEWYNIHDYCFLN